LAFLPEVLGIFKKKKNGQPDLDLLPTVKISAQTDEICRFGRGENFMLFLGLGVSKSP